MWISLRSSICDVSGFLHLNIYLFPQVGEIFSYYFFRYVCWHFLFLFFSWKTYKENVFHLMVSQSFLKNFDFLIYFSFGSSVWMIFFGSSSSPVIHSAAASSLLLNLPRVFFSLAIIFFCSKASELSYIFYLFDENVAMFSILYLNSLSLWSLF